MRAVSFVHNLVLEFPGNLCKGALVLGDVDNDSSYELVAGNTAGEVAIFRGSSPQPALLIQTQGMIASLAIGDILNQGQNFLVVVSIEGWCHIFDIKRDSGQEVTPFHVQRLPANTKTILLADVDGDGNVELVLGLTDRVVRTYRWVSLSQVFQSDSRTGKLVGLHKWEFGGQIGSIIVDPSSTSEKVPHLLVAQPGGTYLKVECAPVNETPVDNQSDDPMISKLIPKYHSLALTRMRNPQVSTEIIGQVKGMRDGQPVLLMAIATLDGTLMLTDGDTIIWSLQVDHQLFALAKLDLTGDGLEEVIACAWDGHTYMVNQDRMSIRFQFEEPVCAFTAGYYSLDNGKASPCLVYATFQDTLHVYYDVKLLLVKTLTFMDVFLDHPKSLELLKQFNLDPKKDQERIKQLCHLCLYGPRNI